MSYELIATLMFSSMMLMLLTGQRVLAPSALSLLLRPSHFGEIGVDLILGSQPL